jgi:hypothetical protein
MSTYVEQRLVPYVPPQEPLQLRYLRRPIPEAVFIRGPRRWGKGPSMTFEEAVRWYADLPRIIDEHNNIIMNRLRQLSPPIHSLPNITSTDQGA